MRVIEVTCRFEHYACFRVREYFTETLDVRILGLYDGQLVVRLRSKNPYQNLLQFAEMVRGDGIG